MSNKLTEHRFLLELENDLHLLDYETYDGVPIWMMSRYYLLYKIAGGKMYGYISSDRDRKLNTKTIQNITKTAVYNTVCRKKWKDKSILLYTTNRKTIDNGKFFNRYVDLLYDCFPDDSIILEQPLMEWEWPFPRHSQNVYFDTLAKLFGELKSKISYKRDLSEIKKLVDYFANRLENICEISLEDKEKEEYSLNIAKLITTMRYQAEWLEKRITNNIKVAIVVGSGFPYYYFHNMILKKRGIICVELQHGFITSTNIMYNYAPQIAMDSRVELGMPQYTLTYGEWWNNQMNCFTKRISIGNPYRTYTVGKEKDKSVKKQNSIVVMGTGEKTEEYIKLTKRISEELSDFSVLYRPHPGEGNKARVLANQNDVRLDDNIDIYATLKKTEIIVSEVTTVLFEAIGIVNRIIVWDTEYSRAFLPEHPFERFLTVEDFVRILQNNRIIKISEESFWADKWEQRYREFVRSLNI